MKIFNFDLDVTLIGCSFSSEAWTFTWYIYMCLPLLYWSYYFGWYHARQWYLRVTDQPEPEKDANKAWYLSLKSALFISNLLYITVTTKALLVWKCKPYIHGETYLVYYPDIQCYKGPHIPMMFFSILGILCYTITWPALMAYVFYRGYKENLYECSPTYSMVWGFLFKRYEREWFWWQMVIILQKFSVVLIKVFMHKSEYQMPTAIVAIFFFILAQTFARPFDATVLDRLQTLCLCAEFFFIFVGILVHDGGYGSGATDGFWYFIFVVSMAGVAFGIYRDLYKYFTKGIIRAVAGTCVDCPVEAQRGIP